MYFVYFCFSVLTIGFEMTQFDVRESGTSVTVPVVIMGAVVPEAGETISITANTADGSATGENEGALTALSICTYITSIIENGINFSSSKCRLQPGQWIGFVV